MTSGWCWQLHCYPAAWLHQDLTRKCNGQRKARRRPAEVKGSHASCWLLRAGLDGRQPGRWQRKHTAISSNRETICCITLKRNMAVSPDETPEAPFACCSGPQVQFCTPSGSPGCCAQVHLSTPSFPHHTAQINHCLALRFKNMYFYFFLLHNDL